MLLFLSCSHPVLEPFQLLHYSRSEPLHPIMEAKALWPYPQTFQDPVLAIELSTPTSDKLISSQELIYSLSLVSAAKPAAPTLTILDGPGGFGKTTLLRTVEKGRQRTHRPCFFLNLGNAKLHDDETVFVECIENALEGCTNHTLLILFDALEEFISNSKWDLGTFFAIINEKVLKTSSLVIATRSSGVDCLYKNFEKVNHHYVVEGFSLASMEKYFETIEEHEQVSRLLVHHRNVLPGICKIPLICSLLVEIVRAKKIRVANITITEIIYEIVLGVVNRELQKTNSTTKKISNLYSLKGFSVLSKLAFFDLLRGSHLDSLESFALFLSVFSIENSLESLDKVDKFNLIDYCECDSFYARIKQRLYWFLTDEIRDFLAAFYLHLWAPLDQLHFISKHAQSLTCRGYSGWLQFFYGLIVKREVVYNLENDDFKSK